MRETRTSGSVGAPPGDRRGYPTLPNAFRDLAAHDVFVDLVVVLDVNIDGDGDLNLVGER